jgi:aspartyl-tRNA(Asn)/glutamyl-tRNA(Gln) amidotransferase subunit A
VTTPEAALAAAEKVDATRAAGKELGKLAGVPIGMKDLFATKGVQTSAASKILEGFKPQYDRPFRKAVGRGRGHAGQAQPGPVRDGFEQ